MLNQSKRNSFTHGVLNNHFNAKKTFSSAAIRDIIYYGGKHGFSEPTGKEIFAIVSNNCANQVGFKGEDFLEKLWEVLVCNSRAAYFALKSRKFENQYRYRELDHIAYKITDDIQEMMAIMDRGLTRESAWPLYIDTEGAYPRLSHESTLSLITIFDVDSKSVHLFRTVRFTPEELEEIKKAVKRLEEFHNMVTFGPESSLLTKESKEEGKADQKLNTLDIQKGKESLVKMLKRVVGKEISKSETMSCWTVPELRHDQIHYAAMDAIALHYINIKSKVDWSFNPPRMLTPDTTPTFYTSIKPNSDQLKMLGDICDNLEDMEDVVDWMQEFDVCITLEKIRKKLEALRTWEKECDKYWKLVVERQVHGVEDVRTSRQVDRDQLDDLLVQCREDLRKVLEQ
ncbi:hypothetical protein CRE_22979 [Caenorhabditis remanei]|uniref:3'-5' exonuclease domain-containing protein n=1 Tax=Caenorhabditis remanei TaxID=31234 RepID=E3MW57_CAERE|nr:hypothetical protein CRE_22979 [Caenorhabditis remanei]